MPELKLTFEDNSPRETTFEVTDMGILRHTPIPECGGNMYKVELVMSKEAFVEAFNEYFGFEPSKTRLVTPKNGKFVAVEKEDE